MTREGPVSEDLRARIMAAADRLRYRPNLAARALASRRSGLVGMVIDDLGDAILSGIVQAAQGSLERRGYGTLVALNAGREGTTGPIDSLLARGAEARLRSKWKRSERRGYRGSPSAKIRVTTRRSGTPVVAGARSLRAGTFWTWDTNDWAHCWEAKGRLDWQSRSRKPDRRLRSRRWLPRRIPRPSGAPFEAFSTSPGRPRPLSAGATDALSSPCANARAGGCGFRRICPSSGSATNPSPAIATPR